MIGLPKLGASANLTLRAITAWNTCVPKKLLKSVATCRDSVVRSSNIVRRIPSISKLEFNVLRIRIRVSSNSETPSKARYSHWMGTRTELAQTKAFKVNKSKAGGQSRITKR